MFLTSWRSAISYWITLHLCTQWTFHGRVVDYRSRMRLLASNRLIPINALGTRFLAAQFVAHAGTFASRYADPASASPGRRDCKFRCLLARPVGKKCAKNVEATHDAHLLRDGFDLRTVQSWAGHRDIESTMRYLRPASAKDIQDKLRRKIEW